jgi:hypothetical protein
VRRYRLNELAPGRAEILDGLFPAASRTRHDAVLLKDILPGSGGFHAVIANPPFQQLESHLHAALDCLAEGGRLSAIVPTRLFEDAGAMQALGRRGHSCGPGVPTDCSTWQFSTSPTSPS